MNLHRHLGEMTFTGKNGKEKWIIDVPRREEAGIKQNKLLYTLGIDERITIYRKAVYLLKENNSQAKSICMLEDIVNEKDFRLHTGRFVLFDSKISEALNLEQEVYEIINQLDRAGAKVIDISKECGFVLDPPAPEVAIK